MLLLQFSTSPYCRKVRLALGYKQIAYRAENLATGAHILRLKPLTGLTTVPTLLPELPDQPTAIGDSTQILRFLDAYQPQPSLGLDDAAQNREVWLLEDWLDESIGIATRFVYYHFRSHAGKQIDPAWLSQLKIRLVRWQYGIGEAQVTLAADRLRHALDWLQQRWQAAEYIVGDRLTAADITAAGLLSPLALIPDYRQQYDWLFERIIAVHQRCGEPLPPGLETAPQPLPEAV